MRKLALGLGISIAAACAAQPPAEAPVEEAPVVMPEDTIKGYVDASPAVAVADADAAPETDWNAELAWARSKYPALAGYELETPVKALLEWAPADGKPVSLFISLRTMKCLPAEARRRKDEDLLSLTVITKQATKAGVKTRDFTDAQAGEVLRYGFGGGTERVNPDGSIDATGAWGASDTGNEGILSSVEGDVARFDGVPMKPVASCGPIEKLPCGDSGSHECNRCTQVNIDFQPRVMGVGRASVSTTLDMCKEPCPNADNPDFDRLTRVLAEQDDGWKLATEGPPTRLYKTLAACKADRSKRGK